MDYKFMTRIHRATTISSIDDYSKDAHKKCDSSRNELSTSKQANIKHLQMPDPMLLNNDSFFLSNVLDRGYYYGTQ